MIYPIYQFLFIIDTISKPSFLIDYRRVYLVVYSLYAIDNIWKTGIVLTIVTAEISALRPLSLIIKADCYLNIILLA